MKVYVFHDKDGEILCITPNKNEEEFCTQKCVEMDGASVVSFIKGHQNPSDYRLTQTGSGKYVFEVKEEVTNYSNMNDSALVEIEEGEDEEYQVHIINDTINRTFSIAISPDFKDMIKDFIGDDYTLNGASEIPFFFLHEENTSIVLQCFVFRIKDLMLNDKIIKDYTIDLEESDLYAKSVFTSYKYEIIDE